MKKLFLIATFLFTTGALQAQTLARLENTRTPVSRVYVQQVSSLKVSIPPPAQGKRIMGMVLAGVGTALQVAGAIQYKEGSDQVKREEAEEEDRYEEFPRIFASESKMTRFKGAMMFITGTGLAIPGTVLWIKGAKAVGRYKQQQTQSLRLNLGTMPSLSYRF